MAKSWHLQAVLDGGPHRSGPSWRSMRANLPDAGAQVPIGHPPRTTFRPQLALAGGLAVILALSLGWGDQLVRSLEQIEADRVTLQDAHVRGEQILLHVRTNVLLGSIYLRDAIIDGPAPSQDYYRLAMSELRDVAEQSLRSHVPELTSSVEREHWVALQREVREFWSAHHTVLIDSATASPVQAAALLRHHVTPRRDTVLEMIDELAALQAAGNRWRQGDTLLLYQRTRAQLLSIGVLAVAAALGIALMASLSVSGLRRQRASERPRHVRQRAAA